MRRLAELRGRAVYHRTWVDEVRRIELIPAVVALVSTRLRVSADRTGSFDVPIGKRVPRCRRKRAESRLPDQAVVLEERAEDVASDARVIRRGGAREAVVRNAEIPEILAD